MKRRTVVDCNVCEETIDEKDRIFVQIDHGTPVPYFETGSVEGQWADFCPACWRKIATALESVRVER